MIKEITAETHDRTLTFIGHLLEQVEGEPYPDTDDFYEYEVYERYVDKYFVCVSQVTGEIKVVESPKQVIDFFGFDPIAKNLYERLGFSACVEISSHEDGQGASYELASDNDKNYKFVGTLIHRKLLDFSDEVLEIYKLNIQGYISATKTYRGYRNVCLLDEQALIEIVA